MMPLIYAQKDEPQIIRNCIAWLFIPLGWGNWQAAPASIVRCAVLVRRTNYFLSFVSDFVHNRPRKNRSVF